MSYSFGIRAATAALAIIAVNEKLDEVVLKQPGHALDVEQAKAVAAGFINVLGKDIDQSIPQEIRVDMTGSISRKMVAVPTTVEGGEPTYEPGDCTYAGVQVSAYIGVKE